MEHDHTPPPPPQSLQPSTEFEPVPLRARHDGWTPERQVAFIEALAETACVVQAATAVGMSATAAYHLRRRPEAQAFRLAWDAALDFGVRRLEDSALSRAIHGVARPVFFQGQQVGERRYYDERLTQFILRRRDPVRFGDWRNGREAEQHFDGPALLLARMLGLAEESAYMGEESGTPAPPELESLAAALGVELPKPEEEEDEDEDDFVDVPERPGPPNYW
ncbi:MAG: hypothetical protein IPO50_10180 [Sphingomonadales bacterium]|nr:hypothetical protein [Sphingomonadales bacterium]